MNCKNCGGVMLLLTAAYPISMLFCSECGRLVISDAEKARTFEYQAIKGSPFSIEIREPASEEEPKKEPAKAPRAKPGPKPTTGSRARSSNSRPRTSPRAKAGSKATGAPAA